MAGWDSLVGSAVIAETLDLYNTKIHRYQAQRIIVPETGALPGSGHLSAYRAGPTILTIAVCEALPAEYRRQFARHWPLFTCPPSADTVVFAAHHHVEITADPAATPNLDGYSVARAGKLWHDIAVVLGRLPDIEQRLTVRTADTIARQVLAHPGTPITISDQNHISPYEIRLHRSTARRLIRDGWLRYHPDTGLLELAPSAYVEARHAS